MKPAYSLTGTFWTLLGVFSGFGGSLLTDLAAFVLDFAFYTVAVIVLALAVMGLVRAVSSAARRLARPNGSAQFSTVKK